MRCLSLLEPLLVPSLMPWTSRGQGILQRTDVLLVIDDAWELCQVRALACLDGSTHSAMVVTTRIQGLVPGAAMFPLGVLDPDAAVALLLETAGALAVAPYEPRLYEAAEACGRLPLILAVAGSMLEQFGGRCTDEFMRLLTEDRCEALRSQSCLHLRSPRLRC